MRRTEQADKENKAQLLHLQLFKRRPLLLTYLVRQAMATDTMSTAVYIRLNAGLTIQGVIIPTRHNASRTFTPVYRPATLTPMNVSTFLTTHLPRFVTLKATSWAPLPTQKSGAPDWLVVPPCRPRRRCHQGQPLPLPQLSNLSAMPRNASTWDATSTKMEPVLVSEFSKLTRTTSRIPQSDVRRGVSNTPTSEWSTIVRYVIKFRDGQNAKLTLFVVLDGQHPRFRRQACKRPFGM